VALGDPNAVAIDLVERTLRDRLVELALNLEPVALGHRTVEPVQRLVLGAQPGVLLEELLSAMNVEARDLGGHDLPPRSRNASAKLGPAVRPRRLRTEAST